MAEAITRRAFATPRKRLHMLIKLSASLLNGAEGFSVEQSFVLRKQCLLESLEEELWSSGLVPIAPDPLEFSVH